MIDFQLANFPQLDQLHDQTTDGYPAENADMDCVPTSIAAALEWLTGRTFDGDGVLDAVPAYGEGYTGGTSASAFVDYCAQQGVKLSSIDGTPAQLVAMLHTLVHQGQPALVTIPGQWNNPATSGANPGPVTHVCCVCGDGPGEIRMMNPWGGFWHDAVDAWLENKLCYGQIWPMERIIMAPKSLVWYTFGQAPLIGKGLADVAADLDISVGELKSIPQNSSFANYDNNPASVAGMEIALPGYPQAAPPPVDLAPVLADLKDAVAKLQTLGAAKSGGESAPAEAAPAAPAPVEQPTPAVLTIPPGWQAHLVEKGETLESIAAAHDLGNARQELYQPNMDTIESAARAAGHPGSNQGEVLIPGTVLLYR